MYGNKLRKIRKKRGLTQKEVSEKLCISRTMYTNIENGIRNPSLKVMRKIVKIFGEEAKNIFFA